MIIKDSIRFVIASIAMVLFVLFGCGTRTAYADDTSTVTPAMSKTIKAVEGEEDTYELSLSIKTTKEILKQTAPLDVIFVIDLSDSMNDNLKNGNNPSSSKTRLQALKDALTDDDGLIKSILGEENNNNRLALVTFAGKNAINYGTINYSEEANKDATIISDWEKEKCTDIATLTSTVNELETDSTSKQTNIAAGLLKANELLSNARTEAKKVIVLLTDGKSNHYYDANNGNKSTYGSENDKNLLASLTGAAETLNESSLDALYSISFATTDATNHLTKIHDTLAKNSAGNDIVKKIFQAGNESELLECFQEIVSITKTLMFQNVEITDILSDWVELISGEASNFSVVQIAKGDTEDKATELSSDVVTITTTTTDKKTQVSATFAKDFEFQDGYTYILKFKVRISQDGYDKFADTGCATLPSNDKATVSYTYDGITQEVEFNVPTIDSVTLKIPITVKWDMLDGQETSETSVAVELFQDGGENSYRKEDVTGDKWISSFTSVAKGKHTYTVKAPDITGFTKTVENVGTEAKPEFVVTYVQLPSLTISKTLIKEEEEVKADDDNKVFDMTVTLTDEGGKALTGKQGGYIFDSKGQTKVSVSAGESVTLSYLPRGTQYTVKETDKSSAGYDVAYTDSNDGTLNKSDQKVTVTNTKLPSLTISKTVEGDYGDKGRDFAFTITLTNDGSNVSGQFTMTKGEEDSEVKFEEGTATVTLKHDESVVIKDLPLGASYTVEETADSRSGYMVTYNGTNDKATGTLDKSATVAVVNTMGNISSTGGSTSHGSAVKLGVLGGLAVLVTLALVARKVKKDDL